MKRHPFMWLILCSAVFSMMSMTAAMANDRLLVFVSILPQKYFTERIAGDRADVRVLVGPGQSPATYDPTPRQMADLSKALVFFRIGVPFETSLIPKIAGSHKNLMIVDTRTGIELREMHEEHDSNEKSGHAAHDGQTEHDAPNEEHHDHEGEPDPHIWLDPILVKTQARTIAQALIKLDPEGEAAYRENLNDFLTDLDKLHGELSETLAPLKGQTIFVFHPAYGYFTDRYGLKQEAVETGGKQPSAKRLAALIEKAKRANVRVIFVQPQFDKANAETIAAAIDGAVIPLNPLAEDYISNLRDMARKIKAALSSGT